MADGTQNFKAGQRVRLLKDIWDDGADHHPPGYLAQKGEVLIVREVVSGRTWRAFPLYISHKHITDRSFGVQLDEVEAAR